MSWPTQIEYQDALQSPAHCFTDPELASATVVGRTPFGAPLPITGHFTNVYRVQTPAGNEYAVRLFLQNDPQRAVRWQTVAAYLKNLPTAPPSLVPFDYQSQGLFWKGQCYPLLKMPWIAGEDLHAWIDRHFNNSAEVGQLAEAWRVTMQELTTVKFVHGDLQHGNILIMGASPPETLQIRLIDYDGALIPGMFGQPLRENGHPAYQHPRRFSSVPLPADAHLDRFPALLIYTALRVLTVAPQVWYRLDNGENLLFRREDLANPGKSRAFSILAEALRPYPSEKHLVETLNAVARSSFAEVPLL
jgi:hypothetical protein